MTQTYVGFKCYWLIHGAFQQKMLIQNTQGTAEGFS